MYIKFNYRKLFWLLLGFIVACFFTSNVKAYNYRGFEFDNNTLVSLFNEKFSNYDINEYKYVSIMQYSYNSNYSIIFTKTNNLTYMTWSNDVAMINGNEHLYLLYNKNNNSIQSFGSQSGSRIYFNDYTYNGTTYYKTATNYNVIKNGTTVLEKAFDYVPMYISSSHNVNFHLNGGNVIDLSNPIAPNYINLDYQIETTTDELEEYLGDITIYKDNYTFGGWYYDSEFTQPYNSSDTLSSDIDLYAKWISNLPDYLNGYKKITLSNSDKYYMLSGLSSGSVFIPTQAFEDYGGRLSYYDNDLDSQPYTSYIQDYYKMPDGEFVRQDFDLSQFYGADWVMFSKYIYLEGEDNITYDIYVPNDIYESDVTITPNPSTGGNNFDFDYKDSNGDVQSGQVQSVDLSQDNPLLGNIFSDFSSNTFGLTSIITAPLSLIRSLSSTSCIPLNLPLPFVGGTLTLPCMYSFYSSTFGVLFTLYQTITFGIVAYWVMVRIFNMVKDFKNPDHDEIEVIDL